MCHVYGVYGAAEQQLIYLSGGMIQNQIELAHGPTIYLKWPHFFQ
jgi:hypothetical protein